jgi:hypothetical protein
MWRQNRSGGAIGPVQLIQKGAAGARAQRLPDSTPLISRSDVMWRQNRSVEQLAQSN